MTNFVTDLLYKLYVLQNEIINSVSSEQLQTSQEKFGDVQMLKTLGPSVFQGTRCWVTTQSSMDFLTLTSWVTFAKMQKLSWIKSYLLISILSWVLFFSTNIIFAVLGANWGIISKNFAIAETITTNSFSIFLFDWWTPGNLSPSLKHTVVQGRSGGQESCADVNSCTML